MILGTITAYNAVTGVKVKIDGEASGSTMQYSILSSYFPAVGDRVLIEEVGGEYVILGKVTSNIRTAKGVFQVGNRISNADDGSVALGIRNGELYYSLAPSDGGALNFFKVQKAS